MTTATPNTHSSRAPTPKNLPLSLVGKKVAILSADGFEESELFEPKAALEKAGAEVHIISPEAGKIKGWKHTDWGKSIAVDYAIDAADPSIYSALMLPGGVMNPDQLRLNPSAVKFALHFVSEEKPIAAICHGPQTLIETGAVYGKTMTSWPSLETDLTNAGATWVNEEVVVDRGLVTSRKPDDIPAFNEQMIHEFATYGDRVVIKPGMKTRSARSNQARRQNQQ